MCLEYIYIEAGDITGSLLKVCIWIITMFCDHTKSKIFKHAHRLARKTKREYPDADYSITFGSALKSLFFDAKKTIAVTELTRDKLGTLCKEKCIIYFKNFYFDVNKFVFVKPFGESDEKFLENLNSLYLQMISLYTADSDRIAFLKNVFVKKLSFVESEPKKKKAKRTGAQIVITYNDIFLDIPYSDREIAKKAGAKWHPTKKRWYYKDAKSLPPALYKYLPKLVLE